MRPTCPDCTCCTQGSCTREGRYAGYCRFTCPCPPVEDVYDETDDYLDEF